MEITEVRIKLMENPADRLRGFCSVTFDSSFVIRDLKIIEGNNGPFVAMPSRKLTASCRKCRSKNHLRANYCNQCGSKIQVDRVQQDTNGRAKLYADIAHPINARCREMIQQRIVVELEREVELSKEPGYRSRYDEAYDDSSSNRDANSRQDKADKSANKGFAPEDKELTRIDAGTNPVPKPHSSREKDSSHTPRAHSINHDRGSAKTNGGQTHSSGTSGATQESGGRDKTGERPPGDAFGSGIF